MRDLRHDLLALDADSGVFRVGIALASPTIPPALGASLGASDVVIGAIPAPVTLGRLLSPLLTAAHTEARAARPARVTDPRRRPDTMEASAA